MSTFIAVDQMQPLLAFIGMPGPLELIVVLAILLLLFGNRLPSVMRSLGKGITEFKKGVQGVEEELEEATTSISNDSKKDES
jgi:sec-independent protein translocase protein TatA